MRSAHAKHARGAGRQRVQLGAPIEPPVEAAALLEPIVQSTRPEPIAIHRDDSDPLAALELRLREIEERSYLDRKATAPACAFLEAGLGRCDGRVMEASASGGVADDPQGMKKGKSVSADAAARGAGKLTADVSDSAVDFFQKRGFAPQTRNTRTVGGEWLANTTMEKKLAAKEKAP